MKGMVNMKNFEKWLNESGLEFTVNVDEKGNKIYEIKGLIIYCNKGTRQAQVQQENGWKAMSYKKLIQELEA